MKIEKAPNGIQIDMAGTLVLYKNYYAVECHQYVSGLSVTNGVFLGVDGTSKYKLIRFLKLIPKIWGFC